MLPSDTIILRRISPRPVRIRSLGTGVLLSLLSGGFGLSLMETIGVQAELDKRREHAWESHGRHFYRYAPRLNDATETAFGSGFFDTRYFAFRDTSDGSRFAANGDTNVSNRSQEEYFAASF